MRVPGGQSGDGTGKPGQREPVAIFVDRNLGAERVRSVIKAAVGTVIAGDGRPEIVRPSRGLRFVGHLPFDAGVSQIVVSDGRCDFLASDHE